MEDLVRDLPLATIYSAQRREVLVNDIRRLFRLLPHIAVLPPTYVALKPKLDWLVTSASGLNEKRAKNIRGSVRAALRWHYARRHQMGVTLPISDAWRAVRELAKPHQWHLNSVSRLIGWCSRTGITPTIVSDETIRCYMTYLEMVVSGSSAREQAQAAIRSWNKLHDLTTDWPRQKLSKLPDNRNYVPRSAYSTEFLADIDRFSRKARGLEQVEQNRRFNRKKTAGTTAVRKLRASTVNSMSWQLRRAAALLATAHGVEITSITSLSQLLENGAFEDILEQFFEVKGDAPTLFNILKTIKSVAQRYVEVDIEVMEELGNLLKQVKRPEWAMTERNRRRLRALTPTDLAELYALPETLMSEVSQVIRKGQPLRREEFAAARLAATLSLLLFTPPRLRNLASIRLGSKLILPKRQDEDGRLYFSADEMKGGRPLDLPIKPHQGRILTWYVQEILPLVAERPDPTALFPGPSGSISPTALAESICSLLRQRLGMDFNVHFFRHLVAHRVLVETNGDYIAVQKLLGHESPEVTRKFYCGEETEAVLQHVAICLQKAAERLKALECRQAPRSRKRPRSARAAAQSA